MGNRWVVPALALALLATPSALGATLSALAEPGTLPTPNVGCGPDFETVTGRIFGEPETCADFVSYGEFRRGLDLLNARHPDRLEPKSLGSSYGWDNALTGNHDTFDVMLVEVTNEKSPVPYEEKPKILFMLSIHGNEKGGREGGFRVLEDFAAGIGMVEQFPELEAMLDWVVLLLLFPNPDGWTHEEIPYRHNNPNYLAAGPVETQGFVRYNGNGVDLNREAPTMGWFDADRYTPVSEPESIAYLNYLKNEVPNLVLATDIHGMLQPADASQRLPSASDPSYEASGHFILTMLSAGQLNPLEHRKTTMLAQTIMDRINNNEKFETFYTRFPSIAGAWGGEANQWGTVWDTIGYTDSGFSSDWFLQDIGLNAPGVDFEMAYNHITFDNYYPGVAQAMNVLHVETVRQIVRAFLEMAALGPVLSFDVGAARAAYVLNPLVVTNLDDVAPLTGWAALNPNDDAFDIAHRVFQASPNDYFRDLRPHLRGEGGGAAFDGLPGNRVNAASLGAYDTFIVGGSAVDALPPDARAALADWTRAGGSLVLTDRALTLLEDPAFAVVQPGEVGEAKLYAGFTNFYDRSHPLVAEVRGLARQTYEPVPLGYAIRPGNTAPNWYVGEAAMERLGGQAVGWVGTRSEVVGPNLPVPLPAGGGLLNQRVITERGVNYGSLAVGEGHVRFLGSLLPDPTEEFYHPYGLASYATTYTGNQLFLNMLDWKAVSAAPKLSVQEILDLTSGAAKAPEPAVAATANSKADTPALGAVAVALGLVAALAVRRRRAA